MWIPFEEAYNPAYDNAKSEEARELLDGVKAEVRL